MNSEKRNQILGLACEALQTEADALLRIKRDLGDEFVNAVEAILSSNNKDIMTGMGKPAPAPQVSTCTQARHSMATSA